MFSVVCPTATIFAGSLRQCFGAILSLCAVASHDAGSLGVDLVLELFLRCQFEVLWSPALVLRDEIPHEVVTRAIRMERLFKEGK